ncbi:oxidoreductase, partial [Serratia marcescens]
TPGSAEWGKDDDAMSLFIGTEPVRTLPTPDGDQRQYYVQVRDALRGVGANPVTAPQALAVMAVLEAATLAAETGVTQALPLTEAEIAAW